MNCLTVAGLNEVGKMGESAGVGAKVDAVGEQVDRLVVEP